MKTFHQIVANTVIASTTNNFLWFALTFWIYLETRSVIATSLIGGGYMLLYAASGIFFGTFVDRNKRMTSMMLSSGASLVSFSLAGIVYVAAPAGSLPALDDPITWLFIALTLAGAIAGNLRSVALSTTVTLLVPADHHDKANGLVGTANGIAFALTSVFSGLAVGGLGIGACVLISVGLSALATGHLALIRIENDAVPNNEETEDLQTRFDLRGALSAVRIVPGLFALLLFSTFNNFLGGVFMALMDPYGLELMSVEVWGIVLAISSLGFIVGGVLVSRRGLGSNPVRTLLLVNALIWTITILFPLRSSIIAVLVGFFIYMMAFPAVEASEQTVIQRVVPFRQQGRVFGFAQTVETAASPVTAFLIGPLAETFVIPFMTDGTGARTIGDWFGTGPERGMALVFIVAGLIGLVVSLLALNSSAYRRLSRSYADKKDDLEPGSVGV